MVAKIGHGTSLFGALSYNKNKVDKEKGEVIFAQNIIESADGSFPMHDILRSFEPYLVANKRTEKPVIHISLNPDSKDKVSDEAFREMAQRYMDELGFGSQPYLVFKHTDVGRPHIHIVSVRVREDGSCISDAYEKRRSMEICRGLERDFKLRPADKAERQQAIPLQKVNYEKGNIKRQVSNAVRDLAKTYRFQSLGEYKALLSCFNLTVEEVKGDHKGIPYNGLVYSVLNDKGEKTGNPFKSSLFGKSAGYDALQKRMLNSKEQWKTDKAGKNRLRTEIREAVSQSRNRTNFERYLSEKGIGIVIRENEQGRIYGITFIDHETKTVVNGSRLGKDFSANVFHDWFADGNKPDFPTPQSSKTSSLSSEETPFERFEKADTESGLQGISLLEVHGDNYEDELFKKRIRSLPKPLRRRGLKRRR